MYSSDVIEGKPGPETSDLTPAEGSAAGVSADLPTPEESERLDEIILAEYEGKLTEADIEFIKYALRLDANSRKFFVELAKTRLLRLEMERQKGTKAKG